MIKISSSVFERTGENTITRFMFAILHSFTLAVGFGLTAYLAPYLLKRGWEPGSLFVIFFGFIVPLFAFSYAEKKNGWIKSMLGYFVMVLSVTASTAIYAEMMSPGIVHSTLSFAFMSVAFITITNAIVLWLIESGYSWRILGKFKRAFSGGMRRFIVLVSLDVAKVAVIIFLLIPFHNNVKEFLPEWFVSIWTGFDVFHLVFSYIFSVYAVYVMYKATKVPRTVENAIDSGVELYFSPVRFGFVALFAVVRQIKLWTSCESD